MLKFIWLKLQELGYTSSTSFQVDKMEIIVIILKLSVIDLNKYFLLQRLVMI